MLKYVRTSDIYEVSLKHKDKNYVEYMLSKFLSLESRLFCFKAKAENSATTFVIFDEHKNCMFFEKANKRFELVGMPLSNSIIPNGILNHKNYQEIRFVTNNKNNK